jgi:hypothetical protein
MFTSSVQIAHDTLSHVSASSDIGLSRHGSLRTPSLLHDHLAEGDYPHTALLKYTGVWENAIFIIAWLRFLCMARLNAHHISVVDGHTLHVAL